MHSTPIRNAITPLRSHTSSPSPARIAVLWLGIQLAWGAILGIALQARCAQLGGSGSLWLFAMVATSGAIAAAITQLIVGPWSDRLKRRGIGRSGFYAAGSAAGACALVGFFAASSAPALIAAFVLLQTALNVAIGPYQAIVPDTLPEERIGTGSAWIAAMQSAGNALGAVLATLLGSSLLLGIVLALALVAGAAVTLLHLRAIEPVRTVRAPFPLRAIFADLFVSRALVYLGFYTMVGYLYFYVRAVLPHGFPADATRASGIAILLFTLVGSLGAVLAARPADRLDERLVVFTGGGIMAGALLAISVFHTIAILGPAIVAAGVGWGIFLCADWTLACRVLPRDAMAGTMAVWNLAVLGPQMLAPPLASAVLALTGTWQSSTGPTVAIALAGAEMLAGALWIWRLPDKDVGN